MKVLSLLVFSGIVFASSVANAAYVRCSAFQICTEVTNTVGLRDGVCYANLYKTYSDCTKGKTAAYWKKGESYDEIIRKVN